MKYIESLHITGWEYGSVNIHHDTFFLGIFQLKGLNVNPSHDTILCDAKDLGAVSIRKMVLPGMAIPMLKIRRPNGRLIFNMEITIRR